MYLIYDTQSDRIVRRAWTDVAPAWVETPPEGCEAAHEPAFSQSSREEMMAKANTIHEPGEDYDASTETSVAYLCYDAETGQIYPDAEIR